MRTLLAVIVKELHQLRRDPKILPILFVAPVIQLIVLGYAATTDVQHVELAVLDADHTPASRDLILRFDASPYFRHLATVSDQSQLHQLLDAGEARLALSIPEGFAAARKAGAASEVQVIADGANAMVAGLALGYAEGVVASLPSPAGTPPPILELRPKVLYNPDLLSRMFMVPGVLAMIIMVMTMVLSSMALVREGEVGTMEQILVTPLSPATIILGKLVPYALVGIVEICTALPVVLLWFDVPLRGPAGVLALLTVPFILCTLGLGLLVSTLARTQQQAMMIATLVFMLPQIYLSGFIFPIQNMPQLFQWITYAIPLRYYVTVLRGVFLKGVGLEVLWPQGLAMLGLGVVLLTFARLRFRRQLG
jgi:ABC-2 type transport system permease protein